MGREELLSRHSVVAMLAPSSPWQQLAEPKVAIFFFFGGRGGGGGGVKEIEIK